MKPTHEGRVSRRIYLSETTYKRLESLASPNQFPNDLIRDILDNLDTLTTKVDKLETENQQLQALVDLLRANGGV